MSLTSTEASDTLATSVYPPSTSPESTSSHSHLRRRMHILENSRSNQQNGLKPSPPIYAKSRGGELSESDITPPRRKESQESPGTDHGFDSNSINTSPGDAGPDRGEVPRENFETTSKRPQIVASQSYPFYPSDSVSQSTRAWYEFDLSVVIALASPIGKWLTGGDHVRNFLLILLLIFYLHQIIEIPWTLYHNSRPRRRLQLQNGTADPNRFSATTELRTIELFFLVLTVLSPLLGAMFLRCVIATISGTDALSWFSTGLFVLATGMRPWRHLVDRVNQRTNELHTVIHYPPVPDKLQSDIEEMSERIRQLEKSLAGIRVKVGDTVEDVYGYVDDAVDTLQNSSKKHEKQCEKQEARLKEIEESLAGLKKGKEKEKRLSVNTNVTPHPSMQLISFFPSWLGLGLLSSSRTPHRTRHSSQYPTPKRSSYPSSSSIRLESIPEEDTKPVPDSRSFQLRIPGAHLVLRWGDLATLPLRRVVHYLLT